MGMLREAFGKKKNMTTNKKHKRIINLTPHKICYKDREGSVETHTLPPSGNVARVSYKESDEDSWYETDWYGWESPYHEGATTNQPFRVTASPQYDGVENLPEPDGATMYVVSGRVLQHCAGRDDVVAPATGPNDGAIRNEKGHIVAVTQFVAAPPA